MRFSERFPVPADDELDVSDVEKLRRGPLRKRILFIFFHKADNVVPSGILDDSEENLYSGW